MGIAERELIVNFIWFRFEPHKKKKKTYNTTHTTL